MCHLGECFVVGVFVGLFFVIGCFIVDPALSVSVELVKFVNDFGCYGPPGVCVVK